MTQLQTISVAWFSTTSVMRLLVASATLYKVCKHMIKSIIETAGSAYELRLLFTLYWKSTLILIYFALCVCFFFIVTPNRLSEDLHFSDLSVEVRALLSSYYKERYVVWLFSRDEPRGEVYLKFKCHPLVNHIFWLNRTCINAVANRKTAIEMMVNWCNICFGFVINSDGILRRGVVTLNRTRHWPADVNNAHLSQTPLSEWRG